MNISHFLIRTRNWKYQDVRNVHFPENVAFVVSLLPPFEIRLFVISRAIISPEPPRFLKIPTLRNLVKLPYFMQWSDEPAFVSVYRKLF